VKPTIETIGLLVALERLLALNAMPTHDLEGTLSTTQVAELSQLTTDLRAKFEIDPQREEAARLILLTWAPKPKARTAK
jgi:hypothetical protein